MNLDHETFVKENRRLWGGAIVKSVYGAEDYEHRIAWAAI